MVFGLIKNYIKGQYQQGYDEGRAKITARNANRGDKPFGAPWGHTYGTAYFMTPEQLIETDQAFAPSEVQKAHPYARFPRPFLGYVKSPTTDFMAMAMPKADGHILTIAPTRRGKGACAVIPNLLTYEGSILVNDIKGENYAVTARRRVQMNQQVFRLAPFESQTDHWNPFDEIGTGDDAWEDARLMADMLMVNRKSSDQFWDAAAKSILTGIILNVATSKEGEDRTIAEVRRILTLDWSRLETYLEFIEEYGGPQEQRAATQLRGQDEKLRTSLLATLDSHLSIWDSPRLARMMSRSDFKLSDLKTDRQTIYVIIPPERMAEYAPVLRLIFGMAVNAMTRTKDKPEVPVLLMIDEFPQLGHMQPIEKGVSYLAGYGVNLWLFAQDLKQLVTIYGEASQSIVANCGTKQFFGVADHDTATLVSKMCGDTSVPVISVNSSGKLLEPSSSTLSTQSRPLLDPSEVMSLPDQFQLLFFSGQRPVIGLKYPYYDDKMAHIYVPEPGDIALYDLNPFHEKDGDRMVIAPFSHGADGDVLIVGITGQPALFRLDRPAIDGQDLRLPACTAFVAFRGMLAVAPWENGTLFDLFTVYNGNTDYRVKIATAGRREIVWESGPFQGARYRLASATTDAADIEVESYGSAKGSGEDDKPTKEELLEAIPAATNEPTFILREKILRAIRHGYYVRYDTTKLDGLFTKNVQPHVAEDVRNLIVAMNIMSANDVENPRAYFEKTLKPLDSLSPRQ